MVDWRHHQTIGLGYLPSTEGYKIVRFFYDKEENVHCEVFNLIAGTLSRNQSSSSSSSSWKVISVVCLCAVERQLVFLHGCLYWLVHNSDYEVFTKDNYYYKYVSIIISFALKRHFSNKIFFKET